MSVTNPDVQPSVSRIEEVPPWPKDCPEMPRKWGKAAMGFERRPMVGWFDPGQLARTGIQAVLSAVFGSYADRREVQAALAAQEKLLAADHQAPASGTFFDYSDRTDLWFDYIADLGDGFDATYQMARQLAKPELNLAAHETTRGEFLIFGGDQVYPTASREEYQNRLVGPYRAALPFTEEPSPRMYAIPGNHDWYDGLTSFSRLFCQNRWIGGWKTAQNRSYFAIKLANDWWIWGIDVQLASDVDYPQVKYFRDLARNHMAKGSKVILCTAEPSWVYCGMKGADAYSNLEYFERELINGFGHTHVVGLAGDLHTYARYENGMGTQTKQRFISGGGGAYLYPTHKLPKLLDLPEGRANVRYGNKQVFPETGESRRMSLGTIKFSFLNWKFALFMGALYLIFAWALQSTSILLVGVQFGREATVLGGDRNTNTSFLEEIGRLDADKLGGVFDAAWHLAAVSPVSILLLIALVFGLIGFADIKNGLGKFVTGAVHAAAHIAALLVVMWLIAYGLHSANIMAAQTRFTVLFAMQMVLFGGLVGSIIMGLYLTISNLVAGAHTNEVFSCQSIPDYKSFLRFHLKDGNLRIYPIGVKRVPRKWQLWMDAHAGERPTPGTEWIEPASEKGVNRSVLIEKPIDVRW